MAPTADRHRRRETLRAADPNGDVVCACGSGGDEPAGRTPDCHRSAGCELSSPRGASLQEVRRSPGERGPLPQRRARVVHPGEKSTRTDSAPPSECRKRRPTATKGPGEDGGTGDARELGGTADGNPPIVVFRSGRRVGRRHPAGLQWTRRGRDRGCSALRTADRGPVGGAMFSPWEEDRPVRAPAEQFRQAALSRSRVRPVDHRRCQGGGRSRGARCARPRP